MIGLACAYYLSKSGRQVTVIERDPSLLSGSSGGNAGMVVPSHFIPLAAPGVISQGLKWMLDPKSPFFLRPRLDFDLMRWLWLFYRHANAGHVKRTELLLRDIGLESRRLHHELSESEGFELVERGLLRGRQHRPVRPLPEDGAQFLRQHGILAEQAVRAAALLQHFIDRGSHACVSTI